MAIEMGYGHLRPAHAIANALGVPVLLVDQPPLANAEEQKTWASMRRTYERVSRVTGVPWVGQPVRALLDTFTDIPRLHPLRDLSQRTLAVQFMERAANKGVGSSLVSYLQETDSALLTTFFSPAVLADFHGYERLWCVVTDSDINRVWAPIHPGQSRIHYCAPSSRVVRRLRAYGVAKEQVHLTGYPLPDELVGGVGAPVLKRNLRGRLARLDPRGVFAHQYRAELESLGDAPEALGPPLLTYAVGGAGAQAELPAVFLPSLREPLLQGKIRLCLVAGVKAMVARTFEQQLHSAGLRDQLGRSVSILAADGIVDYLQRFNSLLAETDILWTKPSELTFFGGLGIPLVFSAPIGRHERYNQRWATENGAGLRAREPRVAGAWLLEWLGDGTLAAAAWAGYKRLPNEGLYRIIECLAL